MLTIIVISLHAYTHTLLALYRFKQYQTRRHRLLLCKLKWLSSRLYQVSVQDLLECNEMTNVMLICSPLGDSVYAVPVRQVQEQLYAQLIAIREGFYQTVQTAMKEVSSGGAESTTAVVDNATSEEAVNLRSENKKLNYRITTLLRTIDEIEGDSAK